MTIKKNYLEKKDEILKNPAAAKELKERAVAAILGGIGSPAWLDFMNQFADSPHQLARLAAIDGTSFNPEMNMGRAYLVANALFGLDKYPDYLDWLEPDLDGSRIPDELPSLLNIDKPLDFEVNVLTLTDKRLTPDLLLNNVGPLLIAIAEVQHLINQIQDRAYREVVVKSISRNSPIELSLKGAADAIEQIKATVVPWRRKHAEKMARLMEQEKRAEIKSKEAEILERQGHVVKDHAEAQKIIADADKQRAEAERTRLENEKLRVELHRAKIQLALDVLSQVAPNLSEMDKLGYMVKLLPPLETLASSELIP